MSTRTSGTSEFATTYTYEALQSRRHIRVLEIITRNNEANGTQTVVYSLVQVELPANDAALDFEAVSYTWGEHDRVSSLHIHGAEGVIGLTKNLTDALPHITKHSRTKCLWIDGLSINQTDDAEKSIQVGLMSEIYKKARRVIVWLGPEDDSSRLCRQWLEAIAKLIPTTQSVKLITIGSPEYDCNWRKIILRDTFSSPQTDAIWARAIGKFWGRGWFRRGWIVQEMLLARDLVYLTGDVQFSLQDLEDLFTVPLDDALAEATEGSLSYRILMQLKTDLFTNTPQPRRFLRVMAAVAQEFATQELGDRLYGFLGLIEGFDFVPDYTSSVKHNFTRFAATIARQYGSLDFLSMWSANLDELMPDTAPELLGLPSWVPSFSATPLCAPWRLAVGGVRPWGGDIAWNAAAGRLHVHDQLFDAATTNKLSVRGQITDHIERLSSTRIAKAVDVDEAYLTSLVDQIKRDLPGFEHWTQIHLIDFLNTVSCNGVTPRETAEQILDLAPGAFPDTHRHLMNHREALGACRMMGKGRKFMTTEKGRVGLAPWIGSRARGGDEAGSAIVILHGCIVPLVLQRVDDGEEEADAGEWKVIGDCYVEGVMFGESVDWKERSARTFVLV